MKIAAAVLGAIVLAPLLAALAVFLLSEAYLRDVAPPPAFTAAIATDQGAVARGRHIARTRGCFGCHGQQLQGEVFTDQWDWVARAVAPNLPVLAKEVSPQALETAIRHGIGRDGRAFWSMPAYNWVHLTDREMADLIAFLRSAPAVANDLPAPRLGWRARLTLARRAEPHMADLAAQAPPLLLGPDDDPLLRRGERLAMTMCNECHGLDLRGATYVEPQTPDLAIVAAYSPADFRRLMKEGVALGGRTDLGLMSLVGPDRFPHLEDDEIEALHAFLSTLPAREKPEGVSWRP